MLGSETSRLMTTSPSYNAMIIFPYHLMRTVTSLLKSLHTLRAPSWIYPETPSRSTYPYGVSTRKSTSYVACGIRSSIQNNSWYSLNHLRNALLQIVQGWMWTVWRFRRLPLHLYLRTCLLPLSVCRINDIYHCDIFMQFETLGLTVRSFAVYLPWKAYRAHIQSIFRR